MTQTTVNPPNSLALGAGGSDRLVRDVLFLSTFMLIWLTATPFPALADPKLLHPTGDGNALGQILTILLTVSLAAFVIAKDARIVRNALTPILAMTLLWFACSAVFSAHADLAARRLVLAA